MRTTLRASPRASRRRGRGMGRRKMAGVALAALVLVTGCESLRAPFLLPRHTGYTGEDLREGLLDFSTQFASAVATAGDRIVRVDPRPEIRRSALLWKIRLVPLVQEDALGDDPRAAYVDVLTLVVMMRLYLTEGDGRTIFGDQQPIAAETAARLEEEILELGRRFIPAHRMDEIRGQVAELGRRRVIAGSDFAVAGFQRATREIRAAGTLDWVVDIPMSPFRALEGVGSGAAAIHDFNDTALRFSRVVEQIPQQLRWQAELLTYELETRASVQETRAMLASFAGSAERLAATADRLPEELEALLAGSEGALAEANAALETARALAGPLRELAEETSEAGRSWGELFARDPDAPPGRPFDVREYEAAAEGIAGAAAELRALARELDALLASPGLAALLDTAEDGAAGVEARGRALVDHAAWRGVQLLALLFAGLALLRLLPARQARTRERAEG